MHFFANASFFTKKIYFLNIETKNSQYFAKKSLRPGFFQLPFRAIFFYYKKKLCDFLQDKTFANASFLQKVFPIIRK